MRTLKFISQSLQIIILIVGFFPIFFFNLCGIIGPSQERINRDQILIDSIIRDSLIKSDSANLESLFKKRVSTFNIDTFSKFYSSNKISKNSVDSFVHQDSIKRVARYASSNGSLIETNSIYFYLGETFDYNFKNANVLELILLLLPDLIILLSWIGIIFIFGNKGFKFKYLRNISFVCFLSCVLILMVWPLPGFIILSILYLATLIINQHIYNRERKTKSPAANTV